MRRELGPQAPYLQSMGTDKSPDIRAKFGQDVVNRLADAAQEIIEKPVDPEPPKKVSPAQDSG